MAKTPEIIGGDTGAKSPELMDMKGKIRDVAEEVRQEAARFEDSPGRDAPEPDLQPSSGGTQDTANIVYILYLVNIVVPFLGIAGVIVAYSNREAAGPGLRTHYDNQIRIFWTSFVGYLISAVLMLILIGFVTGMLVFVWRLVRVITGMSLLGAGKPVRNANTFAFTSEA